MTLKYHIDTKTTIATQYENAPNMSFLFYWFRLAMVNLFWNVAVFVTVLHAFLVPKQGIA